MRRLPNKPRLRKGSTPNCYRPRYTGKRRIAAERNRRKIQSGKIPREQVLRGNDA